MPKKAGNNSTEEINSVICSCNRNQYDIVVSKGMWASINVSQKKREPGVLEYIYFYATKSSWGNKEGGKIIARYKIISIIDIPDGCADGGKYIIFFHSKKEYKELQIPSKRIQGRIYGHSLVIESGL